MANLYELTEGLLAIQEMLQDPINDEQTLLDTLEAVQGEYTGKMEGYCKVIRNLEYDVENIKTEAKRLTEKKRIIEANIDRLKAAMFDSMKAVGTSKVKGSIFTVAIQKNGGKNRASAADCCNWQYRQNRYPEISGSVLPAQQQGTPDNPNFPEQTEQYHAVCPKSGHTAAKHIFPYRSFPVYKQVLQQLSAFR